MNSKLLLSAFVSIPVLATVGADELSFAPEDDSSLTKDYAIEFTMSIGDITAFIDGQDMSEAVPSDFEMTGEMEMTVTDEYVETVDGRPLELLRTFEAMSMIWEADDESGEADDFGELEGKTVRFKWNADSEVYEKSFPDGDGDEDLLEGLGVDMDLRALLPEGDVNEGDTWSVDSSEIGSIFFFGTDFDDLELDGGGDEISALFASELLPQLEAMLEAFETDCEYMGVVDEFGLIAIEMTGEGTVDLTSLIEEAIASQVPDGFEIDLNIDEATVSLSIESEGELQWDLEAGHMHSYVMNSEFEILVDIFIEADLAGESHELEASIELLGDISWSAGVE